VSDVQDPEELPMCMREQHGFYIDAPTLSNQFQPSGIRFKQEGIERSVSLGSVRFVDDDDLLRRETVPGQPEKHKLILRDNRQAIWQAHNRQDSLGLRFEAPDSPGTLRVRISGATRAVTDANGKIRVLRDLSTAASLSSPAAFQNARDQHGLTLSWTVGGKPAPGRLRAREQSLVLELDYRPGQVVTLEVNDFAGDSLLALESLPDSGASNALAKAEASGGETHAFVPMSEEPAAATEVGSPRADPPAKPEGGWFDLFPNKTRVMAPLLADQREATMRFGYMGDNEHETHFDVQFGGDLVLWWWPLTNDQELSLSIRGLASTRFMVDDNYPQLNSDYFGGVALGYRRGKDTFELYLYHESSHLGDETLDFGRRDRIDYSREALRLLWSREILQDLRVYLGPTFNFDGADPEAIGHTWIFQGGAEYEFRLANLPMYAAVDLQTKEENDWRVNTNAQLGLFLLEDDDESIIRRPRVFLEYFNGNSNMGQYWDEHEATWMLGVGFDF
jgi:hypothetical protein